MRLNIFKQTKKGSATIGILSGVCILIAIGLLFIIWYMILPKIQEKEQKVAIENANIKELNTSIKEVSKAKIVISRIEPSIARFDLAMPETAQYPELINSLVSVSDSSELLSDLTILINNAQDSGFGYDLIGINITGESFYPNFTNLLNNLFNNLRILDVKSITITPSSSEDAPAGAISFNFNGSTFAKNNVAKKADQSTTTSTPANTNQGAINTMQNITNK